MFGAASLRAYQRVERETRHRALRLRLLRLLHARRRPYRPRHRGRAQALRHRRPDPDHRRRRRHRHDLDGESAAKGGSVVAAGDRRIHEAALALLNRLNSRRSHPPTPGMKASKAAQNSSRIASRSIRISWRAPGSTIACPALRRAAKRSIAGVAQTGSAPAATTSVGVRTSSGKRGSANSAHEAEGRIEPADGRVADGAVAERRGDCRRCGRSGPGRSSGGCRQSASWRSRSRRRRARIARRGRRGAAAAPSRPRPSATSPCTGRASGSSRRGARRAAARRAPRRARSPRPSNGRARNAASACRARARSPGSPRGRARTGRNCRTWPLRPLGKRAARQALAAPVEGDDGKAAPAQLGDGLEILLDELGPALEDADRAAVAPRRRPPARGAQRHAVLGLDRHHVRAARDRVVRGLDELQRATWRSGGRGNGARAP